jgi:hypothetical protein
MLGPHSWPPYILTRGKLYRDVDVWMSAVLSTLGDPRIWYGRSEESALSVEIRGANWGSMER